MKSTSQPMDSQRAQYISWVDGCTQGDKKAQRALYEHFYGKMLGVCLRYADDKDEAKDMLQDGFIKVFQKLDGFNREGSLEGWIRRVVVNTALDRLRTKKRSIILAKSEERIDENAEFIEWELEEDETLELGINDIVEAMHQLSPAYRAVFNLYIMEDMTHKEIAEELGISEGTSKSNLAKAKMRLRKILLNGTVDIE